MNILFITIFLLYNKIQGIKEIEFSHLRLSDKL